MCAFWGVTYGVSMYDARVRNVTKTLLPYIVDLLSLSGSVCLLTTRQAMRTVKRKMVFFSRIVRTKYMKFYGLSDLTCKRRNYRVSATQPQT